MSLNDCSVLVLAGKIEESSKLRWIEMVGPDPSSHVGEAVDLNISWLLESVHCLSDFEGRGVSAAHPWSNTRLNLRSRHTLLQGYRGRWFFDFSQGCQRYNAVLHHGLSSCLRQAGVCLHPAGH